MLLSLYYSNIIMLVLTRRTPPPPHPLRIPYPHLTVQLLFSSPKTVQNTIRTWRPRQFSEKTDFEMIVSWLIDWVYLKFHVTNKLIDWLIAWLALSIEFYSKLWIDWLIDWMTWSLLFDWLIDWLIDVQHSRPWWYELHTCIITLFRLI